MQWAAWQSFPKRAAIRQAMRLLVIEDSRDLVANLFDYFEARGYVMDVAPDGLTGLQLATSHSYQAIILDWMLPRLPGPELLRKLRQEHSSDIPVIMLTARDELPDKIVGFRAGADDYLTKPFDLVELELRLQALMARASPVRTRRRVLQVHDLTLDLGSLEARRAGTLLHLYPAGRKILEVLMDASPAMVTRERLEQAVWEDAPPDGDVLRSHIYDLRRAVDGPFAVKLIHTLPRTGYRLGVALGEARDAS